MFIPVNRPKISEADIASVAECLREGWVSGEGPIIQRFEEHVAKASDKRFAVAVSNGTVALELALNAIGCTHGDEVIIPTFSIISLVQAVLRVGATPILVDADPDDWNMSVDQVLAKTTPRTKAIIAMHTYGLCTNVQLLRKHCDKHGIYLVEDAAQAFGQSCCGRVCGSFGHLATFSFYANKIVTTGEGGAVCVDDANLASKLQSLRNLSFSPERRFLHHSLGFNARLSSLQAALGTSQIHSLKQAALHKEKIATVYQNSLSKTQGLQLCKTSNACGSNGFWVYGVVLESRYKVQATELIEELEANGIGCRPFFWCVHEQPVFAAAAFCKEQSFPVAERLARYGLYLPSGNGINLEEVEVASNIFNNIWTKHTR